MDINQSLAVAASNGDEELCKQLVADGADVNYSSDIDGDTALIASAGEGHYGIVTLLVEHGAIVDKKNDEGWTALMTAASGGHVDIINYLFDEGALIEHVDVKGYTPLFMAVDNCHFNAVNCLIKLGANLGHKCYAGELAVNLATRKRRPERPDIVQILRDGYE
uniref:ANK_REP_REGION domain-containing protein n=1 Tax=Globodera pallida TaxID=36090 RepID=A0A183CNN4_GLOPA